MTANDSQGLRLCDASLDVRQAIVDQICHVLAGMLVAVPEG